MMKLDLDAVLAALKAAGAATPAFKALYDQLLPLFAEADQAKLKAAHAEAMADNDAGHARLQAKLAG